MAKKVSRNERKRLKVLWQYEVLDTVPEEIFDDLTELAARICEAPIALISLVDEDRQWFKSKHGLALDQTSREISFCTHAIRHEGLFIVPDAAKDRRFSHSPLVTSDPKIRFYAGAPLITPDGHALGTLCVLDHVPRQLQPGQQQALSVLARLVMTQLELRRRSSELAKADKAQKTTADALKSAHLEIARLHSKLRRGKPNGSVARRKPPKSRR